MNKLMFSQGRFLQALGIVLAAIFCGSVSAANKPAIIPFYGYQFGGTLKTYNGELRIDSGETYGATFEFPMNGGVAAEFSFIRQDTTFTQTIYGVDGSTKDLSDITIDYYLLGGTKTISEGVMDTFVSGSLGLAHFSPKSSGYGSEDVFSLSFGLGADKQFNERIGFRIQARLLLPIQFSGGSVYCGPNGCVGGVSGGTTLVQGDITAGIIIRL